MSRLSAGGGCETHDPRYTLWGRTSPIVDVYPLIFEPIFKPRIWGGRKLESLFSKALPGQDPIGESWELADLEEDQSIATAGPAAGKTLGEIVRAWGTKLIGRAPLFDGRFPLLIKFLDARDTLSIQVHPNEAMAKKLGGRVRIKNEAWYVIDAEDDACIYRGLRDGIDASALKRAIDQRKVESVLKRIAVRKGHIYYLPSGTIHALGAGVVVAEVQTPSDVTYRVYDWDRVDPATGRPRELHLEQALQCISYDAGPIVGEESQHVASVWTAVTSLIRCDSFVIERVRMVEGVEQPIPYEEMVIWIVLEGRGQLTCDGCPKPIPFKAGDTVLLPAALGNGQVKTLEICVWLEVSLPVPSSLTGLERPAQETLRTPSGPADGFVTLRLPDEPASPS